uniref:Uncharacterized protein n=1 Tax=Arundo donax TaxID=35708 RepID=A0A0A8Y5H8_ARUDO
MRPYRRPNLYHQRYRFTTSPQILFSVFTIALKDSRPHK